jgi:hypothetical protein
MRVSPGCVGLGSVGSSKAQRAAKGHYGSQQRLIGRAIRGDISATVLLISGCQDNQFSADGSKNGLFTEKLLQVWNAGAFTGDYHGFHKVIASLMPPTQSPNYTTAGAVNEMFEKQKPLHGHGRCHERASGLFALGEGDRPRSRATPGAPTFRVNHRSEYVLRLRDRQRRVLVRHRERARAAQRGQLLRLLERQPAHSRTPTTICPRRCGSA